MAKYALCMGINNYPGTGSDLSGCVNDANDWAAMLTNRGFAVSTLLDEQATGRAMRRAIAAVIGKAKAGDIVAIHYSGHGSYVKDEDGDEPDGRDECLCPHDVATNGPITDDELLQLYSARKKDVKLVIFSDSCHSGSVARIAPVIARGAEPARKIRFLAPSAFLSRRDAAQLGARRAVQGSGPPGRNEALLISGCQDVEYSYDAVFNGRPNGAFTFVALRALPRLPAKATYADWHAAIRKVLPSADYPQAPNLFGPSNMRAWKILA